MAEPLKHINYSLEDIQRYLQGKMPATEMHDIEKAALQDPFLADAIEGFNEADINTAKQHLNEINAGLFAEKRKTKIVAFNKRTRWLNIAALVIVLAGTGLVISFLTKTSSSDKQAEIAKVQQAPVKKEAVKDSAVAPASTAEIKQADTALLIAENKVAKKAQPSSAKTKMKEKAEVVGTNASNEAEADAYKTDVAIAASPAPVPEKTMMSRAYAAAAANADSLQTTLQGKVGGLTALPTTFSGKVVDENNKPIAGVTVVSADNKAAVLTDINGDFNLQKNDTLLHVTASTVGYNTQSTALQQGFNKPIMLKQSSESLNDVVVTGYGTQQKSNITGSALHKQKDMVRDSAMPVGGWNNFNNYVVTQLNKDTTTSGITNPRDLVELEFLIDNSGNPYNIKVTKSPNDVYSTKAVEILKHGPKWTIPAKKKKAKVVINF
ncbi:carboxypeptidase-like regulatory domain-containing protein [Parafilimonas sp.]|uniref:carboxypeptidase-like regulatory domain-containing protein n=1 Tax=Parafilimonas sp. TaxID=1969739 RepID=UPI003F7F5C87